MSAFNTHEIADLFFGAAKSETAYGTDIFGGSAPSSGEWCAFRNLEITPLIEHRENPRGTATVSGEPSIPIKVRNDVVWEVPLLGKAGSDLGPIHEALLMMCGLQRTIDAGVDVAYTPYSYNDMAECPSATFAQYLLNEEGDVKKMLARGCRSNFEMVIEMGQAGYIGGTGQALYDDEPTAWSSPPTLPQQYSADKTPMVATSLSLQTEGTTTYPIERLTLASNWNLTALMAGDSTGGGIFCTSLAAARALAASSCSQMAPPRSLRSSLMSAQVGCSRSRQPLPRAQTPSRSPRLPRSSSAPPSNAKAWSSERWPMRSTVRRPGRPRATTTSRSLTPDPQLVTNWSHHERYHACCQKRIPPGGGEVHLHRR